MANSVLTWNISDRTWFEFSAREMSALIDGIQLKRATTSGRTDAKKPFSAMSYPFIWEAKPMSLDHDWKLRPKRIRTTSRIGLQPYSALFENGSRTSDLRSCDTPHPPAKWRRQRFEWNRWKRPVERERFEAHEEKQTETERRALSLRNLFSSPTEREISQWKATFFREINLYGMNLMKLASLPRYAEENEQY